MPYYFLIHLYEENYTKITDDVMMDNQQKSVTEKETNLQQERFRLYISSNILMVKVVKYFAQYSSWDNCLIRC